MLVHPDAFVAVKLASFAAGAPLPATLVSPDSSLVAGPFGPTYSLIKAKTSLKTLSISGDASR